MDSQTIDNIADLICDFIAAETGFPLDDIETDLNLGAYGLSSAAAVKLIGLLEDRLDIRLSPTLVFEHPTVDELSEAVAECCAEATA